MGPISLSLCFLSFCVMKVVTVPPSPLMLCSEDGVRHWGGLCQGDLTEEASWDRTHTHLCVLVFTQ